MDVKHKIFAFHSISYRLVMVIDTDYQCVEAYDIDKAVYCLNVAVALKLVYRNSNVGLFYRSRKSLSLGNRLKLK